MFDCHLHSSFSSDSTMDTEIACETSIKLGLEGIAFTDHYDYDYPGFEDEFNIDFEQYSKKLEFLRTKYFEHLKILKGIEVGYQPHAIEKTNQIVNSLDFDFVIGSVHIIDGFDPYENDDFFRGKSKHEAYIRYLEEIYASVSEFNNFDVIGHIGYIRRYGHYNDRSLRYCDYNDLLEMIFKKVIQNGKGIEINSSGFKSELLNSPMPDFDLIKRYKELGGEIICVGSDAHAPEHIALNFGCIYDRLKEMGFRYTTHFENRVAVFDLLK